jgi:hypothetical protein
MKHGFIASLVCFLWMTATAQERDKIETDRPNQTESPSIVPKGWLQVELGIQRELYAGSVPLYTLPTVLLKYGVSKKFELRLITEYTTSYHQHFTDTFGLSPIKVGFKYNLLTEKGFLPQTAVIVHSGFNRLASKYFKGYTFFAPQFRFTMQHTLTDKIDLGYNLGAEWESTNEKPDWIYTLAPGMELGENWYAYLELFGCIRKDEMPEHNMDAGISYHLTKDMRADVSGGIGLTKNALDHYIAVGFSFRLPATKNARYPD